MIPVMMCSLVMRAEIVKVRQSQDKITDLLVKVRQSQDKITDLLVKVRQSQDKITDLLGIFFLLFFVLLFTAPL